MKSLVLVLLAAACVSAATKGVVPKPRPRIVGGEEVVPNSVPYQVSVTNGDGRFCGGIIISESWVMTAASCADKVDSLIVAAGVHNLLNTNETTRQVSNSKQIIVHPAWNEENVHHDIALVEVDPPFVFNDAVNFVALPSWSLTDTEVEDLEVRATGWGMTSDSDSGPSPVLKGADLFTYSNIECDIEWVLFGEPVLIDDGHVCCNGFEGRSACLGDAGGPLTYTRADGAPVVVGIMSFVSKRGCEHDAPSVFTRVTHYLDFISTHSGVEISP